MKLRVGVFFGGESVEHEVSIISAQQAIHALDKDKYEVIPLYVAKDRKIYYNPEKFFSVENFTNLPALLKESIQVTLVNLGNECAIRPVHIGLFQKKTLGTIDLAIPVMHGTNGEDGTIQGLFEMLKIPFAGCDIYGAVIGQDKVFQKHILHDNHLPITPWFWVYGQDIETYQTQILEKVNSLGYPVILKPARTGSSIGISIAHDNEEYLDCFKDAMRYDEKIITEKVIKPMREINCSVIGDHTGSRASVLEEVTQQEKELLDFDKKYGSGGSKGKSGMAATSRQVPAPLSHEETKYIQQLAKDTFRVLGSAGVCRIDFIMDAETKKIYINEINTIPGSLAFYLWKEEGVDFSKLMNQLITLALDRERRRNQITTSFSSNILENMTKGGSKGSKV
ncbi:D-ala D-ala ligase N-terminal domain protein [Bulleidia extructa W1219]|jgi:D-ala D-ala ligase N-terminal domain protein|uniref:D-alanine--D-alanine ligase n=1 Tax=Bulleidia extructa W1219 TaxID=679192 RepID=D2MND8_9FIRM|nr:D-alanine--D-alanine ligase family protein [Bulleidia extructa]EFC05960.1 D-ala D-ala ligase N-terminal domain protein [Bulleidia extructa W1219]